MRCILLFAFLWFALTDEIPYSPNPCSSTSQDFIISTANDNNNQLFDDVLPIEINGVLNQNRELQNNIKDLKNAEIEAKIYAMLTGSNTGISSFTEVQNEPDKLNKVIKPSFNSEFDANAESKIELMVSGNNILKPSMVNNGKSGRVISPINDKGSNTFEKIIRRAFAAE